MTDDHKIITEPENKDPKEGEKTASKKNQENGSNKSKSSAGSRFVQAVKTLHPNQVKDKPGLALMCLTVFLLTVSLALIRALTTNPRPPEVLQATTNATLLLEPQELKIEANSGQAGSLLVNLATDTSSIYGTDVVINYADPAFIDGIIPNASTTTSLKTFAPVFNADTNPNFDWTKAVDPGAHKIEFGAVTFDFNTSAPTTAYQGTTLLATMNVKANSIRKRANANFSLVAQNGQTTESNIVDTNLNDVLSPNNVNAANVHVLPEPVCRAAVSCDDDYPSLNDLMLVIDKYNQGCSRCDEDMDDDGNIGLVDLMFIIDVWEQHCPVAC